MLVLKATSGNGFRIQFQDNLVMIVGTIKKPESYQFLLVNKPDSQLLIPLKLRNTGNVTVYETVSPIQCEPLTMSIVPSTITLSNKSIEVPIVGNKKLYILTTTTDMQVETYIPKYKLQCIGKRKINKKYQYVFYKY